MKIALALVGLLAFVSGCAGKRIACVPASSCRIACDESKLPPPVPRYVDPADQEIYP